MTDFQSSWGELTGFSLRRLLLGAEPSQTSPTTLPLLNVEVKLTVLAGFRCQLDTVELSQRKASVGEVPS